MSYRHYEPRDREQSYMSDIEVRVERGNSIYENQTRNYNDFENPGINQRMNFTVENSIPPPPPSYDPRSEIRRDERRSRGRDGGYSRYPARRSPSPFRYSPPHSHTGMYRRSRHRPRARSHSPPPFRGRERSRSPMRYTGHKRKREYNEWEDNRRYRERQMEGRHSRNEFMRNRAYAYMKRRDIIELIAKEAYNCKLEVKPVLHPMLFITLITIEIEKDEQLRQMLDEEGSAGYNADRVYTKTFEGRDSKKSYSQQLASKDALEFIKQNLDDYVTNLAQNLLENEDEGTEEQLKDYTSVTSQVNDLYKNTTSSFDALQRVQRVVSELMPFRIRVDRKTESRVWVVSVKCGNVVVEASNKAKHQTEIEALRKMMDEFKRHPIIVSRYQLDQRNDDGSFD